MDVRGIDATLTELVSLRAGLQERLADTLSAIDVLSRRIDVLLTARVHEGSR